MIMFVICLCLLVAAPVGQIVLSVLKIRNSINLSLSAINAICLLAGLAFPMLATYLDLVNLPAGVKCGTPSMGFVFLGIIITIIAIPVTAIIFFAINYIRNRKAASII